MNITRCMLIYRRRTKTWGEVIVFTWFNSFDRKKDGLMLKGNAIHFSPFIGNHATTISIFLTSKIWGRQMTYFTCFTVELGWWNSPLLYSTGNNRCTCYRVSWVLSNVDKSAYSQSETRIHPQGPNFYLGCLHWTKDGIVSAMVNWPTYTLFQRSDWCIVSK